MPVYNYKCDDCTRTFDKLLPFSLSKELQRCTECNSDRTRKLISSPQVVFKGDGWADKNAKVKQQMKNKNKRLDKKQNEMKKDAPTVQLAPNVEGERVDSWTEAAKLAKSKGKDTSGYEKKVRETRDT